MKRSRCTLVAVLLLAGTGLAGEPSSQVDLLIDPGPFGPTEVRLEDGRMVLVPAETHAFYRMLTQDGRIHGKNSPPPSEAEIREGISLRRQHEPRWAARFGARPRTPEWKYIFPVEGGRLPEQSAYRAGHRAEDIFAPAGRKVFAPAAMLIVHAGYLSKTAGEAVVGFVPPGRGQLKARYLVLVHIDARPAKVKIGEVVEAGTEVGRIAAGDETVVGNAQGRPSHLHFVIREERPDGRLEGIPVWDLLRQALRAAILLDGATIDGVLAGAARKWGSPGSR